MSAGADGAFSHCNLQYPTCFWCKMMNVEMPIHASCFSLSSIYHALGRGTLHQSALEHLNIFYCLL